MLTIFPAWDFDSTPPTSIPMISGHLPTALSLPPPQPVWVPRDARRWRRGAAREGHLPGRRPPDPPRPRPRPHPRPPPHERLVTQMGIYAVRIYPHFSAELLFPHFPYSLFDGRTNSPLLGDGRSALASEVWLRSGGRKPDTPFYRPPPARRPGGGSNRPPRSRSCERLVRT